MSVSYRTQLVTPPAREATADEDEAEQLSPRIGRRAQFHNGDSNSNGANRIVWAVAGFAVVCLVTINGIMWSKLWDMSTALTRLETQVELILDRLPP